MRFIHSLVPSLLLLAAGAAQAASWGFEDGTVTVGSKKADGAVKESLDSKKPLAQAVLFPSTDALKLSLTIKEGGSGKRPHQAFLVLREPETGLEAPFPLTVKDSGKAIVEIAHKDLPVQFVTVTKPLRASLVLASFGSTEGYNSPIFDVEVKLDPNAAPVAYEKPVRYGKKEEINHVFRKGDKSPPKIISLFFVLAVAATVPVLVVAWLTLGANLTHLQKALSDAPISHAIFFGSLLAMEGVFAGYYLVWNLFQTLPLVGIVGVVMFLSGTKALGEVQSRRLAGER